MKYYPYYNYKGQRKSEYTFYWLFKELNILVCPYCGTSYLEFIDTPKPKLRFHIDHFIPKAMAPYLSLSFYNLIPACNNCNSGEKGEKLFQTVNTYPPLYIMISINGQSLPFLLPLFLTISNPLISR